MERGQPVIILAAALIVVLCWYQRRAYAEDPNERQWHTPHLTHSTQTSSRWKGWAKEQVVEHLSRGLIGKATEDGKVYLSWRLLASDPEMLDSMSIV